MPTGHPHLFSLGDWVIVPLNKEGLPSAILGVEPASLEVCEITGIVETAPSKYTLHLAGDGDKRYECPYLFVRHIPINEEWLKDFGFETCEGDKDAEGWLYEEHRLRLDCRNDVVSDLGYFYLSWREDDDLTRDYRISCRGYGEFMVLLEDTLAELQHFFFRFNDEYPMPLKYKGRSHFGTPKRYMPSAGPILEAMLHIDPRLVGM